MKQVTQHRFIDLAATAEDDASAKLKARRDFMRRMGVAAFAVESAIVSMRTTSPYFSSKMPIAPRCFASAIGSTSVVTSLLAKMRSLTMSSIQAICSPLSACAAL